MARMPAITPIARCCRFEAEGEGERAYFWFLLLVMLSDIASHRLDPEAALTIH